MGFPPGAGGPRTAGHYQVGLPVAPDWRHCLWLRHRVLSYLHHVQDVVAGPCVRCHRLPDRLVRGAACAGRPGAAARIRLPLVVDLELAEFGWATQTDGPVERPIRATQPGHHGGKGPCSPVAGDGHAALLINTAARSESCVVTHAIARPPRHLFRRSGRPRRGIVHWSDAPDRIICGE